MGRVNSDAKDAQGMYGCEGIKVRYPHVYICPLMQEDAMKNKHTTQKAQNEPPKKQKNLEQGNMSNLLKPSEVSFLGCWVITVWKVVIIDGDQLVRAIWMYLYLNG